MTSSPDIKNPGGRPATGQGTPVLVRMQPDLMSALEAFAADQGDPPPSRPEAVCRVLAEHLRLKGYLLGETMDALPDAARDDAVVARYADADPDEGVMVTGVGPMTLRRAVRKHADWRQHHGLGLVSIYRGADKEPGVFDVEDLGRLAEMERFR